MDAMSAWQRWRRLGANDRAETIRAAVLLPLYALAVRTVTLPRILEMIAARRRRRSRVPLDPAVDLSVRAVARAAVHSPFPSACLTRSLVLMSLLGRRGIATELRIGASLSGGFAAHAWVESDGVPLNDPASLHRRYAAFPEKETAA